MTTYDKELCERLCREAMEDDERMTPADQWSVDTGVYGDPEGDEDMAFARGPMIKRKLGEPWRGGWWKQSEADSGGMLRTRRNLRAMANQLAAAGKELERLGDLVTDFRQALVPNCHDYDPTAITPASVERVVHFANRAACTADREHTKPTT